MKKIGSYVLVGTLCSALTLGGYHLLGFSEKNPSSQSTDYAEMVSNVNYAAGAEVAPVDFTFAAKKSNAAVVHIRATTVRQSQAQQIPAPFRDFFGDNFFGPQQPQRGQSSGSGVILREDGYIVTNNHVVENAEALEVTLYDKRVFEAQLIGTDPTTDLAVIKIEEKGLPRLQLANSDEVKIGEWVLAVGNPFNLESTVTAGIVSAKGRNINILRRQDNEYAIESFIQTDAAVNPGNSGGALVNLNGDLVGINTAIATPTGTYAGYSFAVPSAIVAKVTKDLIEFGGVQRGVLGVRIVDVNGRTKQELDVDLDRGVYVESMTEESAAAGAGVEQGDVIVGVDGNRVNTSAELQERVARKRPGEVVTLTVDRNGRERNIDVTLKSRTGTTTVARNAESNALLNELGLRLEPLSKDELAEFNVSNGLRVTGIGEGTLRRQTDLRPGYVVTKVNREPVRSVEEFVDSVENRRGPVMLEGFYPGRNGTFYYAFGR